MSVFIKENIRDIVFGSSTNNLFSFGEPEQLEEQPLDAMQVDTNKIFAEYKITKFLFTKRKGQFCRQNTVYVTSYVREQIKLDFEAKQEELTLEYKRKHKDAQKKQKKRKS